MRTKFVILSFTRQGTHMLRTALQSHPSINCFEEVFNVPSKEDDKSAFTSDILNDLFEVDKVNLQAVGFILHMYPPFLSGREDLWSLLSNMDLKVIQLKRNNLFARCVSQMVATRTGEYANFSPSVSDHDVSAHLDPKKLADIFEWMSQRYEYCYNLFSRVNPLVVTYEDMCLNFSVVVKIIQQYLRVSPVLDSKSLTYKQNTKDLRQIVSNYTELCKYFNGTRWQEYFED